MIQGGRERHARNREAFPFDPASLDAVILSHAHIDHSGRLPLLRKAGYRGRIVTTEPTARLLEILLADSGRIHEEDAKWKIKRLEKRGHVALSPSQRRRLERRWLLHKLRVGIS